MFIRVLLILSGIFIGSSLFAQKLVFNEVGFKLSQKERQEIQLLANYEAMLYDNLFSTTKNDSLTISLNIYKKATDYRKNAEQLDANKSSLGFYSPQTKQIYVYKAQDFMSTVVHEMGHAFMQNNMPNPPRWLNEGISEFFESLEVVNNAVTVYKHAERIKKVQNGLDAFNLRGIVSASPASWNGKETENMYTASYSIVFFMMMTKPDNLNKLVRAYQMNMSAEKAIESVYGSIENMATYYKIFYRNTAY